MPHNRYEALQLAAAQLLIKIYYAKDPQKFAAVIKRAVLWEAEQVFVSGDVSSLNTLLRNTTFAKYLFQFGALCYVKEDFLNFLKSDSANKFSFFAEHKERAKAKFDEIIDGAYSLYAMTENSGVITSLVAEMRDDVLRLFQHVVPDDALRGTTEVAKEPYAPEIWRQIQKDLDGIFSTIAPRNSVLINAGKRVALIVGGVEYKLMEQKIKVETEKDPLLKNDDEGSHCCRGCCCTM